MADEYITLAGFYNRQEYYLVNYECFWQQPSDGTQFPIDRVSMSPSPKGSFMVAVANSAIRRWPADDSVVILRPKTRPEFTEGWLLEVKQLGDSYKLSFIVISQNKPWNEIHDIAEKWLRERTVFRSMIEHNDRVAIVWATDMYGKIVINNRIDYEIYLVSTPIFS